MDLTAHARNSRVSHFKAAEVAALVRGRDVNEAVDLLAHSPRKTGAIILKLLNSALANAKQKKIVDLDSLYVKSIFVNKAPGLKRFRPSARGSAASYQKKHSHISLTLGER